MSEHAEGSTIIEAPVVDVMDVIEDYESYPEWADVETVKVLQRGEGGRATEVAFEVVVPVLGKAAYTLTYRYAPGDAGLSWVTKEARGAIRDIRGEYLLNEIDDATTKVTYRLAVELGVLVPGMLRTQGSKRVIENALERLKRRVEMG
jgi:Polyketide cyclase / dehydrase and lipid transport